jgi:hypothetical protein
VSLIGPNAYFLAISDLAIQHHTSEVTERRHVRAEADRRKTFVRRSDKLECRHLLGGDGEWESPKEPATAHPMASKRRLPF